MGKVAIQNAGVTGFANLGAATETEAKQTREQRGVVGHVRRHSCLFIRGVAHLIYLGATGPRYQVVISHFGRSVMIVAQSMGLQSLPCDACSDYDSRAPIKTVRATFRISCRKASCKEGCRSDSWHCRNLRDDAGALFRAKVHCFCGLFHFLRYRKDPSIEAQTNFGLKGVMVSGKVADAIETFPSLAWGLFLEPVDFWSQMVKSIRA